LSKNNSYAPWQAYGNSKLANILYTRELSRRLKEAEASTSDYKGVSAFVLHPGACRTELGRYIVDPESIPKYLLPIVGAIALPLVYITKSSEQGAQTQIFLAASKTLTKQDSGLYFDNSKRASTSKAAEDGDMASWLWNESENLTKLKYPF